MIFVVGAIVRMGAWLVMGVRADWGTEGGTLMTPAVFKIIRIIGGTRTRSPIFWGKRVVLPWFCVRCVILGETLGFGSG